MINIKFPETNLVKCIFSYRASNNVDCGRYGVWDQYDHHLSPGSLKRYVYRVPESLQGKLKVGDTVLVHCQTGFQICEVAELNATSAMSDVKLAPVVCKVDMSLYAQEVDRAEKLKTLRDAIDKKKKQLESMITYELIAEKSPEFKEMLEGYKALGGEF